jgi:excisionase family DNA binding protein
MTTAEKMDPPSGDRRYWSLEEIADLLGVEYQMIYRLVRRGDLPAVKLGRIYRVENGDLNAYLTSRKTGTTALVAGRCSVCGVSYASELSLKHGCTVCGDPICGECWTRRKIRQCPMHQQKS